MQPIHFTSLSENDCLDHAKSNLALAIARELRKIQATHNPHGHVVLFDKPGVALQFYRNRSSGDTYDIVGGWRRTHDWTDKEKNEVQENYEKLSTGMQKKM